MCLVKPALLTCSQYVGHQLAFCPACAHNVALACGTGYYAKDHRICLPHAEQPATGLFGDIFEG